MFKKLVLLVPAICLLCAAWSVAAEINYKSADEFKIMLDSKAPVIIADIQKTNDFKMHYFFSAVETGSYPVKTDAQKEKLTKIVTLYETSGNDIVIVGPRGGSGAKRAQAYLLEHNVPAEKIFILEGGIKGWPYKEMFIDVSTGCA